MGSLMARSVLIVLAALTIMTGAWTEGMAAEPPEVEGIRWILFSNGVEYQQGCSKGDTVCEDAERPVREVSAPPFSIMDAEVTQAQFKAVMGQNPSATMGECADCPVFNVIANRVP